MADWLKFEEVMRLESHALSNTVSPETDDDFVAELMGEIGYDKDGFDQGLNRFLKGEGF